MFLDGRGMKAAICPVNASTVQKSLKIAPNMKRLNLIQFHFAKDRHNMLFAIRL